MGALRPFSSSRSRPAERPGIPGSAPGQRLACRQACGIDRTHGPCRTAAGCGGAMSTGAGPPSAGSRPSRGRHPWMGALRPFSSSRSSPAERPGIPVLHRAKGSRADAICILANAACGSGANQPSLCGMAIAFARARYISRSTGGSAVRSAAYNGREAIHAERTGALYYFKHRDAPEHHEVLLPEGAGAKLADAAVLWNAAEAAERRKDAQLAREIVLALPANTELTIEDRIELARRFAVENFVSKGLAVQLDVHAPHAGDTDVERANWHAHLLITTRRIEGEGFAAKKARDLEPDVRRVAGRPIVSEGEAWGEVWRDLQNRYFAEFGIDVRVDPTDAIAQAHIGPIRMRAEDAQANARADEVARANAKAARDPDQILLVLTRNSATFTVRDLERHLAKHIADAAERNAVKDRVLGCQDVVALHDRESGEVVGRYTTKAVREQELRALADAASVASGSVTGVGAR